MADDLARLADEMTRLTSAVQRLTDAQSTLLKLLELILEAASADGASDEMFSLLRQILKHAEKQTQLLVHLGAPPRDTGLRDEAT